MLGSFFSENVREAGSEGGGFPFKEDHSTGRWTHLSKRI